jgi:phenylpropionate dioxygenase-like ring-hydroxylating dioxygenase large terminal subunit
MPNEPDHSAFARKVKLQSYPLVERGGVLWTYMGPADTQPPLPEYEFAMVPAAQTYTSKRLQECNWLQAMEGGIDSSHVSFLHRGDINTDPLFKGARGNQYNISDLRPVFEVVESTGGLYIGARRNAENGNYYWRITQWVMPSYTMIPPRGNHSVHGHFWIPIDDENCWAWSFAYHPTRALTAAELQASCYRRRLASLLEVPRASSWSQLGRNTGRTPSWPAPATPARLPASSRHARPCSGAGSRRAEERLPTESSRHRRFDRL